MKLHEWKMLEFKVKTPDPIQTRQVAKKVKRRNTYTHTHTHTHTQTHNGE